MDFKRADGQTPKISHYAEVAKVFLVLIVESVTVSTQQPLFLGK
jgi:hypothetical protein